MKQNRTINSFDELKGLLENAKQELFKKLPNGEGEDLYNKLVDATPEEIRDIEKQAAKKYKDG